jgi:surface antigen
MSLFPSISNDGRFVAFESYATNLVPGDTNALVDVFVRDRQAATTERVSVSSTGIQGNDESYSGVVSDDGRFVAFMSRASNLVSGDTNGSYDAFLRDRQSGSTERESLSSSGAQGNGDTYLNSMSSDGRYVVFSSLATNLAQGDTNGVYDVFARDRLGASVLTSLCDPGLNGVHACPCANAPSGPGRGCDNSASTGGAVLSASGGAYLSSDSLIFTTSGEKPTGLSVLWQGPSSVTTGIVFGQGVRCVGGTLKRLYSKSAVGGSITAPNYGAGDPTVSARSATLGSLILSGQSRYYFVSYRDPIVLGGCPSSSTFNATQTGRVDWSF